LNSADPSKIRHDVRTRSRENAVRGPSITLAS
jgi:hypothetical protein